MTEQTHNIRIRSMMGRPATLNVVLVEVHASEVDRTNLHGMMYPEDVIEVPQTFIDAHKWMFSGRRAVLEVTTDAANRPLVFEHLRALENHRATRLAQRALYASNGVYPPEPDEPEVFTTTATTAAAPDELTPEQIYELSRR